MMLFLLFAVISIPGALGESTHWSYDRTDMSGPEYWGENVAKECAGSKQSPINIDTTKTVPLAFRSIEFQTGSDDGYYKVVNNGHSVQIEINGNLKLTGDSYLGKGQFVTAQLHFHWGNGSMDGSEHTIDGKRFPLEMHIVNWDSKRYPSINEAASELAGLAVVAVFFDTSSVPYQPIEPLLKAVYSVHDPDQQSETTVSKWDVNSFIDGVFRELESDRSKSQYYQYYGSLTTPNCYESVLWTVFGKAISLSEPQLSVFRGTMAHVHGKQEAHLVNNFRPVQPLNGRIVYEYENWNSSCCCGDIDCI